MIRYARGYNDVVSFLVAGNTLLMRKKGSIINVPQLVTYIV